MTHPAIDPDSVDELRSRLGTPEPETDLAPVPAPGVGAAPGGAAMWKQRAKDRSRQVLAPVVARARLELARAAATEQEDLRREVSALRDEITRVRSDHAAELAALHEQIDQDHPG